MLKAALLTVLTAFVLTVAGVTFAQTTTYPSPTVTDMGTNNDANNVSPTDTQFGVGGSPGTSMPSGAPSTGFGGSQ
jgi:hypothetical protein